METKTVGRTSKKTAMSNPQKSQELIQREKRLGEMLAEVLWAKYMGDPIPYQFGTMKLMGDGK